MIENNDVAGTCSTTLKQSGQSVLCGYRTVYLLYTRYTLWGSSFQQFETAKYMRLFDKWRDPSKLSYSMRQVSTFKRALHDFMTLRGFPVERHRWSERLGHQLLPSQVQVSASLSFTIGNHCKGDVWYFVKCLSRPKYTCTYIQVYKVPLQEVARGVAQERNEKQPAWYEYHYAGNRRIKIVFGYELIH